MTFLKHIIHKQVLAEIRGRNTYNMTEILLTKEEAYMAMYYLLDAIYERAPDIALGTILGDMQLDTDGIPFDSAYKHEWIEAIEKAKSR